MNILNKKETKMHGARDFPIKLYHSVKNQRYTMPLHWHEEHEIIKITKGNYYYEIESQKGVAETVDILYVNSGTLHSLYPEKEDECEFFCIVFNISAFIKNETASGRVLKPLIDGDIAVFLRLSDFGGGDDIGSMLQQLFDALSSESGELQIHGFLLLLLGDIIKNGCYEKKTDISQAKKNISKLKNSLLFIESSYNTPITLQMLAGKAGMSAEYFCCFFKQMTNLTPIEYLNKYRVEIACRHLAQNDFNITELSYECGFNELSYFIRVFKKIMGITPKQYYFKMNQKET